LIPALSFETDSFTGCDGTVAGWGSCCLPEKPCDVSEGDCDKDDDCLGQLLCGTDNCFNPFPSEADCCYDPFQSKQRINLPLDIVVLHTLLLYLIIDN
jgi:hypothetical protein